MDASQKVTMKGDTNTIARGDRMKRGKGSGHGHTTIPVGRNDEQHDQQSDAASSGEQFTSMVKVEATGKGSDPAVSTEAAEQQASQPQRKKTRNSNASKPAQEKRKHTRGGGPILSPSAKSPEQKNIRTNDGSLPEAPPFPSQGSQQQQDTAGGATKAREAARQTPQRSQEASPASDIKPAALTSVAGQASRTTKPSAPVTSVAGAASKNTEPSAPTFVAGGAEAAGIARGPTQSIAYKIDPELVKQVVNASCSTDVTIKDRNKLYAAMNRAAGHAACPPEALARYSQDRTDATKMFCLLQEWVKDPTWGRVEVHEEHRRILIKNSLSSPWRIHYGPSRGCFVLTV